MLLTCKKKQLENSVNNRSNNSSRISMEKSLKENNNIGYNSMLDKYSYNNKDNTLLSSSTNSSVSTSTEKSKAVILKEDIIIFENILPGKSCKAHVIINNREEIHRELVIISPMDPFFCKYSKVKASPKHYLKVPIEFRPRTKGDYIEKIIIRVVGSDSMLTCTVKAKCI